MHRHQRSPAIFRSFSKQAVRKRRKRSLEFCSITVDRETVIDAKGGSLWQQKEPFYVEERRSYDFNKFFPDGSHAWISAAVSTLLTMQESCWELNTRGWLDDQRVLSAAEGAGDTEERRHRVSATLYLRTFFPKLR